MTERCRSLVATETSKHRAPENTFLTAVAVPRRLVRPFLANCLFYFTVRQVPAESFSSCGTTKGCRTLKVHHCSRHTSPRPNPSANRPNFRDRASTL